MKRTSVWSAALVSAAWVACGGTAKVEDGAGGGAAGGGTGATTTTSSTPSSGTTGTGGTGGFGACSGPAQCILAVPGCCGVCGEPTLDDVVPIAAAQGGAFFEATCPDPGGTPCPGCASFENPDIFAYCEANECVEADVKAHAIGACEQASDCRLRYGLGCCECGEGGYGLTAVNVSMVSTLMGLVCDPAADCPDCAPVYPDDVVAACVEGHCEVQAL